MKPNVCMSVQWHDNFLLIQMQNCHWSNSYPFDSFHTNWQNFPHYSSILSSPSNSTFFPSVERVFPAKQKSFCMLFWVFRWNICILSVYFSQSNMPMGHTRVTYSRWTKNAWEGFWQFFRTLFILPDKFPLEPFPSSRLDFCSLHLTLTINIPLSTWIGSYFFSLSSSQWSHIRYPSPHFGTFSLYRPSCILH